MDTSTVVKLSTEDNNETEFEQCAQRISDVSSVSSVEELECTVTPFDPDDVEEEMEAIHKPMTSPPRKKKKLDVRIPERPKGKGGVSKQISLLLTVKTMLMSMPGIPLHNYGVMYQKYKQTVAHGKMEKTSQTVLFKILTVIGQLSQSYGGKTFKQQYLHQEPGNSLSTMSLNALQKRRLLIWLKEFTTPDEGPTSQARIGVEDLPSPAFMLPSPITSPSTTSICCTTVDGRTLPAVAQCSADYRDPTTSGEEQLIPALYRPKTSGNYRSMSWVDRKYRYSLKSPGLEGDFVVKLEVYEWKRVKGIPSNDWWKNAECRAFVPVQEASSEMAKVIQLQDVLKGLLERQPDAEGDYVQMK